MAVCRFELWLKINENAKDEVEGVWIREEEEALRWKQRSRTAGVDEVTVDMI